MKVFIWEHVLSDWSDGMAVAYAATLEEALALFGEHIADQLGPPTKIIDCEKPSESFFAYVYGGG